MQSLLADLMIAMMYIATFYNTVRQTWFLNKAICLNLVLNSHKYARICPDTGWCSAIVKQCVVLGAWAPKLCLFLQSACT